jgi:hypothetical protein
MHFCSITRRIGNTIRFCSGRNGSPCRPRMEFGKTGRRARKPMWATSSHAASTCLPVRWESASNPKTELSSRDNGTHIGRVMPRRKGACLNLRFPGNKTGCRQPVLFFTLFSLFDNFGGNLRRHLIIMGKFHGKKPATAGHRA